MQKNEEALGNRLGAERGGLENGEGVARKTFRYDYGKIVSQLVVGAMVTVPKPWGEEQMQGFGIWDTGATDTTIGKHFADKLGIMVTPKLDEEGNPLTTAEMRYMGTATIKMRIGEIQTPYFTVKVTDFDPNGERQQSELPDFLIGMNIISHGRLEVDCTGGTTVLRFEPEF